MKQSTSVSRTKAQNKFRLGTVLMFVMKAMFYFYSLCCFPFISVLAAPRIAIPPEGVHFKELFAGNSSTNSIQVCNASSSLVSVSRVQPCCGAEARLTPMRIEPDGTATLMVMLKPQLLGEIKKDVRIYCDDPECPVYTIPITGTVVEPKSADVSSRFTLPTIVLAGIADGFNPCAFSIVIVLAGILAVGGRKRRARMLGGWAFCLGSFLTYMAMGLGLMQALRALEGLRIVHDIVIGSLAVSLFILSVLSIRDAFRYRKAKVPSVITLQLPDKVKHMIRFIAEVSWRGPSVFIAGLGCGFLVTLLDALCTGQVYVPVLALISREPEAWCSLGYLAIYNLAFIAPLIVVFMLAAKGADTAQMSHWSKRNVFPSKLALSAIFAILGVLMLMGIKMPSIIPSKITLPQPPIPVIDKPVSHTKIVAVDTSKSFQSQLSSVISTELSSAIPIICGEDKKTADRYEVRNNALESISNERNLSEDDVEALMGYLASTEDMLIPVRTAALKNDIMNLLRFQEAVPNGFIELLIGMATGIEHSPEVIDYSIQHLGAVYADINDRQIKNRIRICLVSVAQKRHLAYSGTALYALAEATDSTPTQQDELKRLTLALCAHDSNSNARIAAILLAGERKYSEVVPVLRKSLQVNRDDAVADIASIGTIGLLGEKLDISLLESVLKRNRSRYSTAVSTAIKRIIKREEYVQARK